MSDNTNNNPETIEADELSKLAIAFKHATKERDRNKLFLEIAEYYMPKIKKHLQNIQPQDRDEFIQIYYVEVYNALRAWKMKSNFSTYLFMYIKAVYRKFMNNIKLFKKDIEYCHMSDLDESEMPIYEDLEIFYNDHME